MDETITLSKYIQDSFVHFCIGDTDFLKSARPAVPVKAFSTKQVREIIQACYNFYDIYKRAPNEIIVQLVEDMKGGMRETDYNLLQFYLKDIAGQSFSIDDQKYLLRKLEKELMDLRLCESLPIVRDLMKGDKADEARQLILASFHPILPSDVGGIDYLYDFRDILQREFETNFLMTSYIDDLDALMGGFRRQNFYCIFGNYGGGKTWMMQHLGLAGIHQGLNVYHASFELPREEMELRYDMMLGGLTNLPEPTNISIVEPSSEKRPIWKDKYVDTIYNRGAVQAIREAQQAFGGKLIIEKFPPGKAGASALDIENRIVMYEQIHGLKFDVVIADYADIMKPINYQDETRHQVNQTYLCLKMIADEYNCLVITGSQVNRPALQKERMNMAALAEDIRKAGNTDGLIAICQTEQQKIKHYKRLFLAKCRSSRDGVGCGVYDNLDIGQFCSWSVPVTFMEGEE